MAVVNEDVAEAPACRPLMEARVFDVPLRPGDLQDLLRRKLGGLAGDEHAPGAWRPLRFLEAGQPAPDHADLAIVGLQGLEIGTVPKLDPLLSGLVLDDLAGLLLPPDMEGLLEGFVGLLAGHDHGAQAQALDGAEERAVGVEGIRHDHVQPREGLPHPLEQPRGRGELPLVLVGLCDPVLLLAPHHHRAQITGQERLDVEGQIEPLVDHHGHRVAVVVLRDLDDLSRGPFHAELALQALGAVAAPGAERLPPVQGEIAQGSVPTLPEHLVPLGLGEHRYRDRP